MDNKNKREGKSLIFAPFKTYLVDVPFKSLRIDTEASIHFTNLLH